jgi:hypothetical protein
MCGMCMHWELEPQGCSSFWGRCTYTIENNGRKMPFKSEDLHYTEGKDCPHWKLKEK